MTDFRPGDRVLVTADCLPPGGMLGTVSPDWFAVLDRSCDGSGHPGNESAGKAVRLDGRSVHPNVMVVLHHRATPPKPELYGFTRSEGAHVSAQRSTLGGYAASISRSATSGDAEHFARLYTSIAEVLRWEEEHGRE